MTGSGQSGDKPEGHQGTAMASAGKPRNRLYVNFIINLIGALLPIPVMILTVPVYIDYVGDARYGVISLIWVMIGYLGFLELGLAPATINALARLDHSDQRERARVIVTSFSINASMTFFGAFLLYLLGSYIVGGVVQVPIEIEDEVKAAMPWIALLLPLVILNGAGIDAIEARENFALANVLQVSGAIFAQILPLAFAVFVSPDLGTVIPGAVLARVLLMLAIFVLGTPQALGQSAEHQLSVSTPSYVGIRIVGSGTGARAVIFDYAARPDAYLTAVDTGAALPPTAVNRFDDVQLNVTRRGRWRIHVQATTFVYAGSAAPAGLALSDIRVTRTRPQNAVFGPGNSARYETTWTLSTTPTEIATSNRSTGGWRSLGFSGWDYSLAVDGDEAAGSYTTVVTYSLTAP